MGKNIRFVIMNNLLPSMIRIHEKYDLKGSTYKRVAGPEERTKSAPTLKDLDFRERHRDGLLLEVDTYEALLSTIQRDCRVLESFRIMDYSLLLGVHNLDENLRTTAKTGVSTTTVGGVEQRSIRDLTRSAPETSNRTQSDLSLTQSGDDYFTPCGAPVPAAIETGALVQGDSIRQLGTATQANQSYSAKGRTTENQQGSVTKGALTSSNPDDTSTTITTPVPPSPAPMPGTVPASTGAPMAAATVTAITRQKTRSRSTRRIAAYSTMLESIQAPVEQVELQGGDEEYIPTGGIPARNKGGDRLILYMGIIDILQSYQMIKKMEHNLKAMFLDASTISVTDPRFYAQRFQDFFANVVFRKIPSPMRQNPERKPSASRRDVSDKGRPSVPHSGTSSADINDNKSKVDNQPGVTKLSGPKLASSDNRTAKPIDLPH